MRPNAATPRPPRRRSRWPRPKGDRAAWTSRGGAKQRSDRPGPRCIERSKRLCVNDMRKRTRRLALSSPNGSAETRHTGKRENDFLEHEAQPGDQLEGDCDCHMLRNGTRGRQRCAEPHEGETLQAKRPSPNEHDPTQITGDVWAVSGPDP